MVSLPALPFDQELFFINNEWVPSTGSQKTSIENPDTGEIIGTASEATKDDVDRAVDAAYNAFYHGPWVNEYTASQRRDALLALASSIEERRQELELIESLNTGKPISAAREEMTEVIDILRHFAGYADKVEGRHLSPQFNPGFEGYSVKVPVGVVAQINSFNYPAMLWAWKVAPSLAAGCTVVFKPGPQTPLTTLYFGYLMKQTGLFPPGVYNVICGGIETGQALVDNDKIDKVGFTGSVTTGKHVIKSTASTQNIRMTSVELGGKSPIVVMPDFDLDKAAEILTLGFTSNTGMNCNCGSRAWIHKDIYDQLLAKVKAVAESVKLGNPVDESTQMGPVIDKRQFDRVMEYIRIGKEEDKANVLTGGERAFDRGHWIKPTVFTHVDPNARIATEEVFGPVLSILTPFESLDEVIEIERKNTFGLAAAILTHSNKSILNFTRNMRNGTIWVNTYDILFASLPFGGFRNSGFGRELGRESFEGYLVSKSVITDVNV